MESMRCVFKGCDRTGAQLEGYTYFACEECLDQLEEHLNAEYEKRLAALATLPVLAPPEIVARIRIAVKL
jgi:hypothetical protein